MEDFELSAVMRRDLEKPKDYALRHGVPKYYEHADNLINDPAIDATGSWIHESGVTGSGSWNFGYEQRENFVQIYGDRGKISFSIFGEIPLVLEHGNHKESIIIENPENIQLFHIQNMKSHLLKKINHPSTGKTALHTTWVLESILKNNNKNLKPEQC